MFLHQIILKGTFNYSGFIPTSFSIVNGEEYYILSLKYTEYWKYGLEKYVCSIKNQSKWKEIFYDKHREKWFIKVEKAIDEKDILIDN